MRFVIWGMANKSRCKRKRLQRTITHMHSSQKTLTKNFRFICIYVYIGYSCLYIDLTKLIKVFSTINSPSLPKLVWFIITRYHQNYNGAMHIVLDKISREA